MHSKAYRCFELVTKKMIFSKDVRFHEWKPGYPLLQAYPIEKTSKTIVQFEITSSDKTIHVQPNNTFKASSNSLV
jgi:hypothetical protein